MPKHYSPEFRRKVLDLVKEGRPIAEVASDLGVTCWVQILDARIDLGLFEKNPGWWHQR